MPQKKARRQGTWMASTLKRLPAGDVGTASPRVRHSDGVDSNHRPRAYEARELAAALPSDRARLPLPSWWHLTPSDRTGVEVPPRHTSPGVGGLAPLPGLAAG